MFRRYVLPLSIILILSFAVAGASHAATAETRFRANCVFQVVIHLSRAAPQTPEHQSFLGTLAAQQTGTAIASGVYAQAAQKVGIKGKAFQRDVSTAPASGLGTFVVFVINDNGHQAIRFANAVCEGFVTTIKAQRAREIDAQVKNIEARLTAIQAEVRKLEAIPVKKRTTTQNALLAGQRSALNFNTALVANIISLPPDDIAVLAGANAAVKQQSGNLSRNLVVALVGGLLACFLYVLAGEVIMEARRVRESEARPEP